jgi:hypothetical protein
LHCLVSSSAAATQEAAPAPIQFYPPPPGYRLILAGPGAGTLQRIPPPPPETSSLFPPGVDVNNAALSTPAAPNGFLMASVCGGARLMMTNGGHARRLRPPYIPSASELRYRAATEAMIEGSYCRAGDALQSEECAICLQD